MDFEFATAARILFGPGKVQALPEWVAAAGRRALLLSSRSLASGEALERARRGLAAAGVEVTEQVLSGEPTVETVDATAAQARAAGCDVVVAWGGGSVVDAGKAVAGLLANGGSALDYLEVVGRGQRLARPAVPLLAVPTTAGTGAEVTRNAVLAVPERRVKASLRSPHLLPRLALVDPQLTFSLPPAITASTGLDALTQLLEAYVTRRANPLTDALARAGLQRVVPALRRAFQDGRDEAARTEMSLASLLSGLALANAGLGAVHGFAAPLCGAFPIPHGVACAALLPYVVEQNVRALQSREPGHPALAKYGEALGCLLGRCLGSEAETLAAGVTLLHDLRSEMGLPSLGHFGVTPADVPMLVAEAERASSMKGNPIPLTPEELTATLQRAL